MFYVVKAGLKRINNLKLSNGNLQRIRVNATAVAAGGVDRHNGMVRGGRVRGHVS